MTAAKLASRFASLNKADDDVFKFGDGDTRQQKTLSAGHFDNHRRFVVA